MKRTFAAAVLATTLLMGAAPPAKTPSGFDLTPDRVRFDLQGLAKSARGEGLAQALRAGGGGERESD